MTGRRAWAALGLLGALGCSSRADTGPSAIGGDGGIALDAPAAPATTCLTGANCVGDRDCPSGSHCNTALPPPACQTLYCGTAATACSEDEQCRPMSRCLAHACTPCVMCGSQCVDLNTDPQNCGACGNAIEAVCVGGRATCPPRFTMCGGRCADLAADPGNCGACGNAAVSPYQHCAMGRLACDDSYAACGVLCVDLARDISSCGGCELRCGSDGRCEGGRCTMYAVTPRSCTSLCESGGQVCVEGRNEARYVIGAPQPYRRALTCAMAASATHFGDPFSQMTCYCAPPSL